MGGIGYGFDHRPESAPRIRIDRMSEVSGMRAYADKRVVINLHALEWSERGIAVRRRIRHRPLRKSIAAGSSAVPFLALSPAASVSFQALPDDGTVIPPDTQGAAGPDRLMVTLNSQVRIQDKQGDALTTVSLPSFWSSLGVSDPFDPRVAYDPFNDRWIFSAAAGADSSNAAILIGVSQSGDPAGNWNLYLVTADPTGTLWADFPTLGFNSKWIVVQANMFTVSGNMFAQSNIWAFDKANLYAGGGGAYTLLQSAGGSRSSRR